MRISIIQADLAWEDKSANMKKIGEMIKPLYFKTDIIILPETFNTGFSMNADLLKESADGQTFKWMSEIPITS